MPNATFDQPGSSEVGGIETFALTVGEAMIDLGHDVTLFGGRPKPGRSHRPTKVRLRLHDYVETRAIPDLGTRFQRLVQRLHFGWMTRKPWLREHFDWALLFKPFDWPVAWYWKCRQPKLKVVMSFHGTDWFLGDRAFYGAVDAAFAVSPAVAALAQARIGRRPPVIPNPIDTAFFTPGEIEEPARTNAAALRIVASGRLVGWKGFRVLIAAMAELHTRGIRATCELAGDGPERAALEAQARVAGLGDVFTLLGRLDREALRDRLRAADVYVAPSVGMEAFSIAAGEAFSVGLPLVLSDQVGLRDFLSAEDLSVTAAGDAVALAAELAQWQQEKRTGLRADRRSRHERAKALFAPASVAAQILELVAGNSALEP